MGSRTTAGSAVPCLSIGLMIMVACTLIQTTTTLIRINESARLKPVIDHMLTPGNIDSVDRILRSGRAAADELSQHWVPEVTKMVKFMSETIPMVNDRIHELNRLMEMHANNESIQEIHSTLTAMNDAIHRIDDAAQRLFPVVGENSN